MFDCNVWSLLTLLFSMCLICLMCLMCLMCSICSICSICSNMGQQAQASDDNHPDAHATRLKLSLVTIDSGEKYPWELTYEACRYVSKMTHVSAECRISRSEELQLLCDDSIVIDRMSPNYASGTMWNTPYDLYDCTIVKNRKRALEVLLLNDGTTGDTSDTDPPQVLAQCWVPPGETTSGMW